MGTLFTIVALSAPIIALAVGYVYGSRRWPLCFRFAGREAQANISGYSLAAVILTIDLALGMAFSPTVSSVCIGLRHEKPTGDSP